MNQRHNKPQLDAARRFFRGVVEAGSLSCLVFLAQACGAGSQVYVGMEYYGGAWGPNLLEEKLPNGEPVYDDSDEVIYFMKCIAVGRMTKELGLGGFREVFQSSDYRIVLCSMREDGSNKKEIKSLWRSDPSEGPNPGALEGVSMAICARTHKAALSFEYGGDDIVGLWTFGLDGSNLRRIRPPASGRIRRVCWHPSGEWLVFEEYERGNSRIGRHVFRCDADGHYVRAMTSEFASTQPTFSPSGDMIVYTCWPLGRSSGQPVITSGPLIEKYHVKVISDTSRYLHRMNQDGTDDKPIFDKNGQPVFGEFPIWRTSGREIIYQIGLVNLESGENVRLSNLILPWGVDGEKGIVGWQQRSIYYIPRGSMDGKYLIEASFAPQRIQERQSAEGIW